MNISRIELPVKTAEGEFIARYSEKGLAKLDFPQAGFRRAVRPPPPAVPAKIPAAVRAWHRATETALKNALAGRAAKNLPPLDWSGKTEFQISVWRELLKIAAGQTQSYGEIAQAIRRPKAGRAVGGACGANPVPVLVPCHRVLAANKRIGGFSGGLDWKRRLLACEGAVFQG